MLFVEAKEKRKKSLLDLSERDVQRIYEQWEVCIRPALPRVGNCVNCSANIIKRLEGLLLYTVTASQ